MTTTFGYNKNFMEFIDKLYAKHHTTIIEIRKKMAYIIIIIIY